MIVYIDPFRIGVDMADEHSTTPDYQLTLKGNGISIEKTISGDVAAAIMSVVMGGRLPAPRGVGQSGATSTAPRVGAGSLTAGEFVADSGATRNPDKIAAFGVFLMDELGNASFTREEMRQTFQRAGEPVPGNFPRDFGWAIRNKWVSAMIGSPNEYVVTNAAREAVRNKFSKEVRATTRTPVSRRRRSRKAAEAATS